MSSIVLYHGTTADFSVVNLTKDKKLNFGDASKIWYNSNTKRRLHESSEDYSYVAPTRCYEELLMELNKDPHWMKGSFE